MATSWDALEFAVLWIGWPGIVAVSAYTIERAVMFYRSVRHSAGLLVLLTVIGWIASLLGAALVSTFYLTRDPEGAGPVVLPVFVLWAGSMVVISFVVHRWGNEAVNLESYYMELEQMERMKSQFINSVAHELNTPIMPLKLQLGLFRNETLGPLNHKQKAGLGVVDRNLDRLSILIDQVILASFVQSGNLQLERQPVSAQDLLQDALTVAWHGEESGPQVRFSCPEGVRVSCDRKRMEAALGNLLGQAMQQDPRGLEVRVTPRDDAVLFELMAEDLEGQRRAFRPFSSADPWKSTELLLGLELYISRAVIEAHGGHVQQTGTDGFVAFTLPAARG